MKAKFFGHTMECGHCHRDFDQESMVRAGNASMCRPCAVEVAIKLNGTPIREAVEMINGIPTPSGRQGNKIKLNEP